MFETLLWALAGSRCSTELFPFSIWARMKPYRRLLLLVPLFLCPLSGERLVGGSVVTRSLLAWEAVGRVMPLPESGVRVSGFPEPFSDFLARHFQNHLYFSSYTLLLYFMSEKYYRSRQQAEELAEYFQCHIGLDFLSSVSTD